MAEIADLTYNMVAFTEIMQMLWKRLNDHGKNWRHVYKALVLLEYLIKTGSEKVAQQCKENIFAIQTLKDFQYTEGSRDQGINVREKAKQLVALLKDDERLRNERARALKAKERFAQSVSGFGSDGIDTGSSLGDVSFILFFYNFLCFKKKKKKTSLNIYLFCHSSALQIGSLIETKLNQNVSIFLFKFE